jgi:hypothetical protein
LGKIILLILTILFTFKNNHIDFQKINIKGTNNKKKVNSSKINYYLKLEKNYSENTSSIYLYSNEIKTDSLILRNVGFQTDSIINYNDSLWYYSFSICSTCSPSLTRKFQLIIIPLRRKLHIAYFSELMWSQKRDSILKFQPSYIDTNVYYLSIKKENIGYAEIKLDSGFFTDKQIVQEYFYSFKSGISFEDQGIIKNYIIKFDSNKQIFYNKKKIINSICRFGNKNNRYLINKRLQNEYVFFLEFYGTTYAYYNGNWYSFFKNTFTPIDMILSLCPLGCF